MTADNPKWNIGLPIRVTVEIANAYTESCKVREQEFVWAPTDRPGVFVVGIKDVPGKVPGVIDHQVFIDTTPIE